jgi:hypothetical protein
MTNETDVLAALDNPRAVHALHHLLAPASNSTDALHD